MMQYDTAVKYMLSITSIDSEDELRKYARRVLYENEIEITDKAIECSIIAVAEYYKFNMIYKN